MRIKKVSDNSAIEAYFQTMQRFNNGSPSLAKEANWFTSLFGAGADAAHVAGGVSDAAHVGGAVADAAHLGREAQLAAEVAREAHIVAEEAKVALSTFQEIEAAGGGAVRTLAQADEERRLTQALVEAERTAAAAADAERGAMAAVRAAEAGTSAARALPVASDALTALFRGEAEGFEAFRALARGKSEAEVLELLGSSLKNADDAPKILELLKGGTSVTEVSTNTLRSAGIVAEEGSVALRTAEETAEIAAKIGEGAAGVTPEIKAAVKAAVDAGNYDEALRILGTLEGADDYVRVATAAVEDFRKLEVLKTAAQAEEAASARKLEALLPRELRTGGVDDVGPIVDETAKTAETVGTVVEDGTKAVDAAVTEVKLLEEGAGATDPIVEGIKASDDIPETVRALQETVEAQAREIAALRETLEASVARGTMTQAEVERIITQRVAALESAGGKVVSTSAKATSWLGRGAEIGRAWLGGVVKLALGGALVYGAYRGYQYATRDPLPPEGPHRGGGPRRQVDPAITEALDAVDSRNNERLQEILSGQSLGSALLMHVMRRYRKDYVIELKPGAYDGMRFAFVDQVPDGPGLGDEETRFDQAHIARQSLDNPSTGGALYSRQMGVQDGDKQRALNETVQRVIGFDLDGTGILGGNRRGKRRTRRFMSGKRIRRSPGAAGRSRRPMTRRQRNMRRRGSDERFDRLEKFASFANPDRFTALETFAALLDDEPNFDNKSNMSRREKLASLGNIASPNLFSTNNHTNNDLNLFKEADEVSKSYYKDAVTDLNSTDKTLRTYFTGLGRLYDEKSETPKGDYKTLYNVHDETGTDLVHAAHPKAIVSLDSIGNGGLVENGLEQQRQTQGVALSTPTGNYRANYAWVRESLKKTSK